jgi:GAF domain-containing protein
MERSRNKTVITVIVVILITIGLIWLETYKRQREEFKLAENYYAGKDFHNAIQRYDSTIHMYTPWSSRVKISAEKLWEIGKLYEDKQEYDMALVAYRSLRSSFYAVRWLVQPYQEWIDRCDTAIARVSKAQEDLKTDQNQEPVPPDDQQTP